LLEGLVKNKEVQKGLEKKNLGGKCNERTLRTCRVRCLQNREISFK
jgi:hypothetical protein